MSKKIEVILAKNESKSVILHLAKFWRAFRNDRENLTFWYIFLQLPMEERLNKDFDEVRQYFDSEEWDSMQYHAKLRACNLLNNHKFKQNLG